MSKLTYIRCGDYDIPNLKLSEQPETSIGKYGRMRKSYLKEHHPILYNQLLMSEKITAVQRRLLEEVADLHGVPEGAYNIRANGHLASRQTTANISIESKTDVSGIDIRIKPGTVNESVHIPVVLSESGLKEMVYNDFYIGEGSDVLIVAGCGIDNCGSQDSQHDGLHRFFVEKNAHVRYVEKHYGSGDGTGKRLLNPGTEVHLAQVLRGIS